MNLIGASDSEGQMGQATYSNGQSCCGRSDGGHVAAPSCACITGKRFLSDRWAGLHDATGSISRRRRAGESRSPLGPHQDWLLGLVAQEPDLTLQELERRIQEGIGLVTSERSIRRFKELLRKATTRSALGQRRRC
jgi:hypothetical protein